MKALTYDDIQLIPQYSEVQSRSLVNLNSRLTRNFELKVPYIAAPMDTVCEENMAKAMLLRGASGAVHRFMSLEDQEQQAVNIQRYLYRDEFSDISSVWGSIRKPIVFSIGVGEEGYKRGVRLVEVGVTVLLIDVAHGHHKNVKDLLKRLTDYREKSDKTFDIIAGNVATYEGAKDLIDWGADSLRVGIGGGSLCTTRVETGHGVPNVEALIQTVRAAEESNIPVIADGGIRTPGDVAKAIAIGADTVMIGSMLSGTEETPGSIIEKNGTLFKRYRGSASLETKSTHNQKTSNVEGESTVVPFKGSVKYVIQRLNDGLSSALSYTGANNIKEYQAKSKFNEVTTAGMVEAKPHLL